MNSAAIIIEQVSNREIADSIIATSWKSSVKTIASYPQ